jgi:hypothetical protein
MPAAIPDNWWDSLHLPTGQVHRADLPIHAGPVERPALQSWPAGEPPSRASAPDLGWRGAEAAGERGRGGSEVDARRVDAPRGGLDQRSFHSLTQRSRHDAGPDQRAARPRGRDGRALVVTTRSSGRSLRRGARWSGYVQGPVQKEVFEAVWAAFGTLTQEASVASRAPSAERVARRHELAVRGLEVRSEVDHPITPKEHGTTFLFEHRHLWLRPGARRRSRGSGMRWSRRSGLLHREGFTWSTHDPDRGHRRGGREPFATDYSIWARRIWHRRVSLCGGGRAALGKALCRPTFRREVEDPAAPHRV